MKLTNALLLALLCSIATLLYAQSFGAWAAGPIAPTVAQCPPGILNNAVYCPVGSGTTFNTYVNYNNLGYVLFGGSGVASFNGRTGNVLPVAGDYSYAQLSSPPTTVNCGATGCAIK